jgi:hypothetical protein
MGVMKRLYTAGARRSPTSAPSLGKGASKKAGGLVIVTGFAQLDAKLRGLPPAMQRKFVRGALRKGAKRIVLEFKRIVRAEAFDTGTLHKAAKVKALKRSRTRVGVSMFIDREKLFANYAAKHGGKKPHPAKGQTEPFYYPASIEFGTEHQPPIRPMRRALYDNAAVYRELFRADVTQFIAENKVTTALPKAG